MVFGYDALHEQLVVGRPYENMVTLLKRQALQEWIRLDRAGTCSTPARFLVEPTGWWPGTESNRRHGDFQSPALPTELPGHRVLDVRTGAGPQRKAAYYSGLAGPSQAATGRRTPTPSSRARCGVWPGVLVRRGCGPAALSCSGFFTEPYGLRMRRTRTIRRRTSRRRPSKAIARE